MSGSSETTATAAIHVAATPSTSVKLSRQSFPTPSFVSPMPVAAAAKEQLQRTLSGGMKKKKQKRKLDRELQLAGSENGASTTSISKSNSGLVKSKKHKLSSSTPMMDARFTTQQQIKHKVKVRDSALFVTPQRGAAASTASAAAGSATEKHVKKPLQDISNNNSARAVIESDARIAASAGTSAAQRKSDVPTRKLDFTATPDKHENTALSSPTSASAAAKKQCNRAEDAAASVGPVTAASANESSSSSSSESGSGSDDSASESGYSSDEAEVAFDAVTLGNTRVVREAESPLSSASTASSTSSLRPVGLEYRFSVSSTVSSIAVAPNGQFLVVGFYNGTIYLYPLTKDSFRFRGGVLLDHITARGMYTQLMVRVALPDDGKFIFAGVYRGSTEIRAFEVDSIAFPSASDLARRSAKDSDDDDDDDADVDGDFGVPHAHAVAHTYSDPKLKGFGAVKSVLRSKTGATEYHLLCGLGIKNVHLWRFFQRPATKSWSWECVFDKQANGISLEFLAFHPSAAHQIISKSEHQNIRVWTLEEELHDDDFTSVTLTKTNHVDVKNTVDTTAVYGDYAYGGSESLALIDLRSANRLELDLPLSTKEQQAQLDAAAASKQSSVRIMASMRQRNSRRRGASTGVEELGGMRHMRTVSQVAGRASSPFTIGMCSDGSVFVHQPQSALGMATPLEYVEGYERFFQDPSLSFQAQFSDLTRVNTSGLLSVLPLPATEREDWMIVAANQDQLLVRSLKAFLCRNEQVIEHARIKRGLRSVMRDLGRSADSSAASSSSDSSSESDSEDEEILIEKSVLQSLLKPAAIAAIAKSSDASPPAAAASASLSASASRPVVSSSSSSLLSKESRGEKRSGKSVRDKSEGDATKESKTVIAGTVTVVGGSSASARVLTDSAVAVKERKKTSASATRDVGAAAAPARSSLEMLSEQAAEQTPAAASASQESLMVTTPKRKSASSNSNNNPMTPCLGGVASPVVSVSSLSSGTSNPNTPEAHSRLSQREKQLLVLKDLEWTPPPKAPSSAAALAKAREQRESGSAKATASDAKTIKQRTKALFASTADDDASAKRQESVSAVALPATGKSSAGVADEAAAKSKKPPSKAKSGAIAATPAASPGAAPSSKAVKQLPVGSKLETGDAPATAALKAVPVATGSNKRAPSASARKEKPVKKRSSKDSAVVAVVAPAAESTTGPAALDIEMADNNNNEKENDAEIDADLEMLEANEPEFVTMPLVSDGGSLLSASLFQFERASGSCVPTASSPSSLCDDRVLDEQAALFMDFAEQTARLKRNFDVEKQRIYQQLDCACVSSMVSSLALKKKGSDACVSSMVPASSTPSASSATAAHNKPNWKKALSGDFLKRKQLKRRQKKQLTLKLRQLHGCYRAQIHELLAVQKLQANALTARQRFNAMYEQLCRTAGSGKCESPQSTATVGTSSEPQPLALAFPYPSLLASLSP